MEQKATKSKPLLVVYNAAVMLLAAASVIMAIMDICGKISPDNSAFYTADTIILIIFAVDYAVRFIIAKEKAAFFKSNIFDLIAIIPFSNIFSLFRFARIFRLAKLAKLTKLAKFSKMARIVGMLGKIQQQISSFLHTNGFIYMLYAAGVLILISSVLISYVENKPFSDALWWSIVTCTTVGYGDISPSTGIGRIVAVVLMIFGIGLISMLTGTITTFFSKRVSKPEEPDTLENIISGMDEDERAELAEIAKIIKK
ncbi:MAG: ion transporter [Oscillospiraceae bacterium]|nr:ion transporter [Oscillospiraceae bacterium]